MCTDLFKYLIETGGPEQKTIIFCARDRHADDVAVCLNNLYAQWCETEGRERLDTYAFKCTAASSGNDQLPDLRASSRSHFIATTVDLLTTGVDVPCVKNIVFFKYLQSPISFHQMVGRGTRIDEVTGKLMFRVYDDTDATRLFGEEFITKPSSGGGGGPGPEPPVPPEPTISVAGFDVHVTPAGSFIITEVDGKAMPVPIAEYKAQLTARLVEEAHTLDAFRKLWVDPPTRQELVDALVTSGYSPAVVRMVDEKQDYDLYDVLAELGWGMNPRSRHDRTLAFSYKHEDWLNGLPQPACQTIRAIAGQFERGGTDELENPQIFQIAEVKQAGGLAALQAAGTPADRYPTGNPIRPVPSVQTQCGGVMIIGAYPSARFESRRSPVSGRRRLIPIADNLQPFGPEVYFDGTQVRRLESAHGLSAFLLSPLGLTAEDCWITDLVKVFPYKPAHRDSCADVVPGFQAPVLRGCFMELARASLPWIEDECALCEPRLIITLGEEVARAISGSSASANKLLAPEPCYPACLGGRPTYFCPHPDGCRRSDKWRERMEMIVGRIQGEWMEKT